MMCGEVKVLRQSARSTAPPPRLVRRPPFAYDYGLRTARAHLRALGAPEPEMPPYDASKHEPIEEI